MSYLLQAMLSRNLGPGLADPCGCRKSSESEPSQEMVPNCPGFQSQWRSLGPKRGRGEAEKNKKREAKKGGTEQNRMSEERAGEREAVTVGEIRILRVRQEMSMQMRKVEWLARAVISINTRDYFN
ncbi:hypothetical protein B0H13DRAFT_1867189 [Mycena leptocephala]|nr:hypothetical protein B0H13DRAFT_1867189 [Mycena leptocephala]